MGSPFGGNGRPEGQEFNWLETWRVGALRALASWRVGGEAWQSRERSEKFCVPGACRPSKRAGAGEIKRTALNRIARK